jgi:hypothetical protein
MFAEHQTTPSGARQLTSQEVRVYRVCRVTK